MSLSFDETGEQKEVDEEQGKSISSKIIVPDGMDMMLITGGLNFSDSVDSIEEEEQEYEACDSLLPVSDEELSGLQNRSYDDHEEMFSTSDRENVVAHEGEVSVSEQEKLDDQTPDS